MARIFDTKVRAKAFVERKNKRSRKLRYSYRKYHGGWLVTTRVYKQIK